MGRNLRLLCFGGSAWPILRILDSYPHSHHTRSDQKHNKTHAHHPIRHIESPFTESDYSDETLKIHPGKRSATVLQCAFPKLGISGIHDLPVISDRLHRALAVLPFPSGEHP